MPLREQSEECATEDDFLRERRSQRDPHERLEQDVPRATSRRPLVLEEPAGGGNHRSESHHGFGVKLTMPTVSVLLLLATGVKSHQLVVAAAAGLAICVVAALVIGLVLWKEQVASALGSIADRVASAFLRPFRKGPVTSLEPAVVEIRRQTIDRGPYPVVLADRVVYLSQLAAFLVFGLSMRFVGIPASKVSLAVVFAAFTFGMLAGSVPVTPGGLGTADAVYIAVMVAGGAPSSAAVAGDLVFRTLTYLLPIPVGAITYVIWRRQKSWLQPGGTEPASSA